MHTRTPVRQAVVMPKTMWPVVILANEESLEESESSEEEPPATEQKTRPGSTTRKGTTRVRAGKGLVERRGPKSQPAVTLAMPRPVPCNWCRWVGRNCFSWTKGPETLLTCTACFKVKMSCKTGDNGAQGGKKAKMLARRTRKDSTVEDVESERMVRPKMEVQKWERHGAVKKLDSMAG